jgi:hypothetical protein
MPIMVIIGRGKRAVVEIAGWTQEQIDGVRLSVEIDGYDTQIGVGR